MRPRFADPSCRARARRFLKRGAGLGDASGFTLIELMVVILMVSILAVMAAPAMLEAQRNRRVYTDASEIMQVFRLAHSRAIGDQAATMVTVTIDSTTHLGYVQAFEATYNSGAAASDKTAGAQAAMDTCKLPMVWTTTTGTATPHATLIAGYAFNGPIETDANMQVAIASGPTGATSFCFTPSGKMFADGTTAQVFTSSPSITPVDISVSRVRSGTTFGVRRDVLVMPSGNVRVNSR